MNDLSYVKDRYQRMIERIDTVDGFTDRPEDASLCPHPDSVEIGVLINSPDKLHDVRQWLKENLGTWEDRLGRVSKTGFNSYQVVWSGVSTDWISITLFANDETVKPFIGEHCKFVQDEYSQHSAVLVCQA
jgi:hypothetical protein